MINDVNNLLLRERGAVTKARPQQFYGYGKLQELVLAATFGVTGILLSLSMEQFY